MQPLETLLAPELQEARKRRRNWQAIGGFVAVALLVGMIQYRPIHDWVQGIRSRRMAAKAESEILGGNFEEAMNKARIAEQIKPDEPAAIRTRARTLGLWRQPAAATAAVQFWKKLEKAGGLRVEDRRSYAEDLLLSGAAAEAGNEIEKLLKSGDPDGGLYRLAARWAATEGDGERAIDFASRAVRQEPENQEGKMLKALLQLSAGTEALREEAIAALLELGREHTREGLEALKQLGTMRGVSMEVAAKVMELLPQHPLATEQHRILAFSIELAIHPERDAEMKDEAVKKYRKAEPAARCAFGTWLHLRKEYARMLELIPVEEAFKRQDFLRVCLAALEGLDRFDEIERILEMKNVPLDNATKELYLAISAEKMGSATVAKLHWQRAHLAAAPSPEQMKELAHHAEQSGKLDQAEIAYRSLSANAAMARVAMEGLLRIARSRGDMEMLCDTLQKMSVRWPQDDSVKNDLAYFNLLTGKAVDESMATAKELVARSPASLAHRTTLALAAIRKRDPAAALSVYQGLRIPWERIAASQRAVYAAALGVNGKTEEASAAVAALRWEDLRPEERELIKQWRKQ